MDRSIFRHPEMGDQERSGKAIDGDPDGPMDLLALGEVAELLGEPESVILAACRAFPDHVPMVGADGRRRFPSIALDVLRLITDATAAGVPPAATALLVDTHFSAARDAATERLTWSAVTLDEPEPAPFDMDELVERIQEVVELDVLPVVRTLASELGTTRAAVDQIRSELGRTARADDLELLRIETRSFASAQHSPPHSADVASELARIETLLRPALHGLEEIKLAVEGLREEVAALRWQLDQREQLGQLVADLAELRKQVSQLESIGLRQDGAESLIDSSSTSGEPAGDTVAEEVAHRGDGTQPGASGEDTSVAPEEQPLSAAAQAEPDTPSAIITEFARRTPRRMGRSLFADEG